MNSKRYPLVLLPGKLCDQALWDHQINFFRKNADVQFIDLSQCRTLSEMLSKVKNESPDRFALAGFSMGGYIALEFALHNLNRLEKLAIIGTSSRGYDQKTRLYYQQIIDHLSRFKFKELSLGSLQQLIHPSRLEDPEVAGVIQTMARRLGGEVFRQQQIATLERQDRRAELSRITCPTLIAGGKQDQIVSCAEFEEFAAALPNSTLKLAEDCGHMLPLEHPHLLNQWMEEWLSR